MPSMNCTLVSKKKSHIRFCLEQPVLEKHLPWHKSSLSISVRLWFLHTTKLLQHSYIKSFGSYFPTMPLSILSAIMTTTSPKHTFLPQTITFPKSRRLTSKSTSFAMQQHGLFWREGMSSSFPRSRAFMVSAPKRRMMECFLFWNAMKPSQER